MSATMSSAVLERTGDVVSSDFHTPDGKRIAVNCLSEAIGDVAHETLAKECGMSPGYFSKVASGQQGDFIGLIHKLRPEIRQKWYARMAELEAADPLARAAEDLLRASARYLQLCGVAKVMAKATLGDR